jgi:hypothetical protein
LLVSWMGKLGPRTKERLKRLLSLDFRANRLAYEF